MYHKFAEHIQSIQFSQYNERTKWRAGDVTFTAKSELWGMAAYCRTFLLTTESGISGGLPDKRPSHEWPSDRNASEQWQCQERCPYRLGCQHVECQSEFQSLSHVEPNNQSPTVVSLNFEGRGTNATLEMKFKSCSTSDNVGVKDIAGFEW